MERRGCLYHEERHIWRRYCHYNALQGMGNCTSLAEYIYSSTCSNITVRGSQQETQCTKVSHHMINSRYHFEPAADSYKESYTEKW